MTVTWGQLISIGKLGIGICIAGLIFYLILDYLDKRFK